MRDFRLTSEADLYNDICQFKNLFLFSNDNGDQGRDLAESIIHLRANYRD